MLKKISFGVFILLLLNSCDSKEQAVELAVLKIENQKLSEIKTQSELELKNLKVEVDQLQSELVILNDKLKDLGVSYNSLKKNNNELSLKREKEIAEAEKEEKEAKAKKVPNPLGTIRGEAGTVKGSKMNLEVATVGAKLEDFDPDIKLLVTGFNLKVSGYPTIVVSGNKLDKRAKNAISRVSKGDIIVISEIKTKFEGEGDFMLPKTIPVKFEIQ